MSKLKVKSLAMYCRQVSSEESSDGSGGGKGHGNLGSRVPHDSGALVEGSDFYGIKAAVLRLSIGHSHLIAGVAYPKAIVGIGGAGVSFGNFIISEVVPYDTLFNCGVFSVGSFGDNIEGGNTLVVSCFSAGVGNESFVCGISGRSGNLVGVAVIGG